MATHAGLVDEVKQEAIQCVRRMSDVAHRLEWKDPYAYATWLSQTYFYVRHATRVLSFAAGHCSLEEEGVHAKLLHGITEEKGHEVLALRDLKAIGYDISQFREMPATSAYYQTLFRNIATDGPTSLIGYFVPLEGLAAVGLADVLKTILRQYGDEGSQFMKMHCVVDEGHFAEGLDFLGSLDPAKLAIFRRYLHLSTDLYIGVLESVIRFVEPSDGKRQIA